MGELGVVRRRKDARSWYIDLRPYARIYSNRGIPLDSKRTAQRVLEQIRRDLTNGHSIHEVLAGYLPQGSKLNRVRAHLDRWLEVKRREAAASSLSPTYLRELERYAGPRGYFSFFDELSIFEINYARIEEFSLHLADLGLSPKTRRNAIGAFHGFFTWLRRRGEIDKLPEFPLPKMDEYEPRILSIEDQDRILAAIPQERRGIFLALAHLGLRPGEARALDVADYRNGWLHQRLISTPHPPFSPNGKSSIMEHLFPKGQNRRLRIPMTARLTPINSAVLGSGTTVKTANVRWSTE